MSQSSPPPFPVSDHCDGRKFFNPGVDTDRGFADLWRWRRERKGVPWPASVPAVPVPPPPAGAGPGELLLTLVGQSTVLIQIEGCNILTDPVWSDRASPLGFAGPKRVRAPGIAFDDLPRIDLVLLSHNHYDHLDLRTLKRLHARSAPRIITGLGNAPLLRRNGIDSVVELDWWQCCTPAQGVDVTFLPAQHWSSRTPWDRRRTLWGGHAVQAGGTCLYFAGDSGYGPHFGAIGRALAPDVALLPIGAYEPRWFMQAQHMDPFDAVLAHRDLGAAMSLGLHWGTFQLTDEAIDAPLEGLSRARAEAGLDAAAFRAPEFGTTLVWRRGPLPAEAAAITVA
jgi:L-ascorbate metabolism protein UlaG (beta-lactamase superfamily)